MHPYSAVADTHEHKKSPNVNVLEEKYTMYGFQCQLIW